MNTPWGKATRIWQITTGVLYVKTKSHGGYQLTPERNEEIPAPLRKADCWYEEDCEAAIVASFVNDECFEAKREMARGMVVRWFPEAAIHLPV